MVGTEHEKFAYTFSKNKNKYIPLTYDGKIGINSFLRELREVAPEMELFPENHSPYEKDFVTKSNPYAKFSARHFTKKLYLEKCV